MYLFYGAIFHTSDARHATVAPEKDGGEGGGNFFQSVALDSFKFDKKLGRTMLRILSASV